MRMARDHHEALVAHARDEAPNECCGYLTLRDGEVLEVFRAQNAYGSPRYGFEFGFKDLQAANDLEDEGFAIGVYHSHPRSEAVPSQQDRNAMQYYTNWVQLIVSLEDEPVVRAWWIGDRRVEEEPIELA
jgi:proteasome lid subunit RPN8/RPN11